MNNVQATHLSEIEKSVNHKAASKESIGARRMARFVLSSLLLFTLSSALSIAHAQARPVVRDSAGRAISPNDVPRRVHEAVPDNTEKQRAPVAVDSGQVSSAAESPFLQLNDFRSIDGFNNNLENPEWGQAGLPLLRLAAPAYADGTSAPSGEGRPNVREISNIVFDQQESVLSADSISDFVWQWGQFLDHDIDLTPTSDPTEPFDIEVPLGDPYFDPDSTGTQQIPLNRSLPLFVDGVREQINLLTSYIDASNVYGSDEEHAQRLRTLDGTGRLKSSDGDLLPMNLDGDPNVPEEGFPEFYAGDERANEQVGLTVMHTLFMREHNYWADRIREAVPELDDEGIYQRARAMVAAEMQCITYNEFLPLLLGDDAFGPYEGYQPTVEASISNEFATAAYRIGHTMLSPQLIRLDAELSPIDAGPLPLRNAFFNPTEVINYGIEPYLRGLASQTAQEIDNFVVADVRNFLFGAPGQGGFDLPSLNLQRGRDHGLPSYNDVRAVYGLPAITGFAEISSNPNVQERLEAAYGTVDDMDLWVVGLSEDHVPGALVGETVWTILHDQFSALRDGDRYWYERYLPSELQREVERRDLRTIIRENTDIDSEISENVFVVGEVKGSGSLRVRLVPSDAVAGGAMWRVDGGGWHESGFELNDLDAGVYTVEFSDVAAYFTPSNERVTIGVGEKSAMTKTYLPKQLPAGCNGGTVQGASMVPLAEFLMLFSVVMLFVLTGELSRKRDLAEDGHRK